MRNSSSSIERIPRDSLPEDVFNRFISTRRPVVISGHPPDESWRADVWTNDYLKETVGHASVSVEYKISDSEGFGLGKRRKMDFAEFVSRLERGQENLYLTSPQQPLGPYGFPNVVVSPMTELLSDFPLRLSWAGHLIPQQINMWMGSSSHGSSSGLHHDYHDNFYILLRGRKRFRIFPPQEIRNMYLHGALVNQYPNGRVVYAGQEGILEDGSHQEDVAWWETIRNREKMMNKNETKSFHDERAPNIKEKSCIDEGTPPSFSKVDLSLGKEAVLKLFPRFPWNKCIECTVSEGETLFLPAGWFHEVTSINEDDPHADGSKSGHLAVNYWLYPPDNPASFIKPYKNSFWNQLWSSGVIQVSRQSGTKSKRRKRNQLWLCRLKFGKRVGWYYYIRKRCNF